MQQHRSRKIRAAISNFPLAGDLWRSISTALESPRVHLAGRPTVDGVFTRSLNAAVRDIREHPRGKLFRRLIEHGPHLPDDPEAPDSDGETVLSDPECGQAVEFIYSHMVNRFKGELAELLALEPCLELLRHLRQVKREPTGTEVYWGDTIQERLLPDRAGKERWGKGADGLLVEPRPPCGVHVRGVVEVKSMRRSTRRVLGQIGHHVERLGGGVRLGDTRYPGQEVSLSRNLVKIAVVPSTWRLSREWHWDKGDHGGNVMVFPEPSGPPVDTSIDQLGPDLWKITLAWSQEALEQAAYEMTFGYMAQVGEHVYTGKPLPKGWEDFTPAEAGRNAVKAALYYMPLRPLSPRQERLAVRLYNVYGFGYPLGVDTRGMLWPSDLVPGAGDPSP